MSEHGSPTADVKPKADGAGKSITHDLAAADVPENALNIKIRATDGSEVFFKIKKTTKLNKLKVTPNELFGVLTTQNAYADRVGQDPGAIR